MSTQKLKWCVIPVYAMKAMWVQQRIVPTTLHLSIKWKWLLKFTTQLVHAQGDKPTAHRIEGLVCPRASLDVFKKKSLTLLGIEARVMSSLHIFMSILTIVFHEHYSLFSKVAGNLSPSVE